MLKPLNLQLGWPTPSLHPSLDLSAAAQHVLNSNEESSGALMYGPDAGHQPLRESIANWLTQSYSTPYIISAERICITNGASANLQNILLRFTDPTYTRRVWIIEPAYFLACPIFEDAGFEGKMRGVPEDEEGLDIEFLRKSLEDVEKEIVLSTNEQAPAMKRGSRYEKLYKHVIYLVPTFANPSAKTMSLRRREDLVRLARQFDALIVTDDVYDLLRWPLDPDVPCNKLGPIPPRIVDVDRVLDGGVVDKWGNSVSNGSFGKIVAPGCRVGWAEGTDAFALQLSTLGSTRSGGAPSHLSSTFIHQLLSSGTLQKHIDETLIPTYRARSQALLGAVAEHLIPLGVRVSTGEPYVTGSSATKGKSNGDYEINGTNGIQHGKPVLESGGFFTWLILPNDLPVAADLAAIALEKYKIRFAYGKMFEVAGDDGSAQRGAVRFHRGIRLSWAWHEEADIIEGIKRIADVIKEARAV